jgi:Flp pilus assembly protein TadG
MNCRRPPSSWRRRSRFAGAHEEKGFFTIWTLGVCVMLLAMGGVSLDLWRGFTERRELAAITDSAAIAGASQLDLAAFKVDGTVQLDPVLAQQAAADYLQTQGAAANITFTSPPLITVTGNEINITAGTRIELTLMKIFRPGGTLNVTTHSAATPQGQP